MRLIAVLACLPLTMPAMAHAESLCQYIKRAEAVGIAVEPGSAALALQNWGPAPEPTPVLTIKSKPVEVGDTISELISQAGLMPDKYNIEIAAALNPDIADLNKLTLGDIVRFPAAYEADVKLPPIDGYKTWPKAELTWIDDRGPASFLFPEAVARFARQPGWQEFEAAANALQRAGTFKGNPFYALESNVAAYQTSAFLAELAQSSDNIIADPEHGAFAVVAKAAVDMTRARGAGRTTLSVKTVSPANVELPDLRVFRVSDASYRLKCLQENKIEFDNRSSPALAVLPIARWWVWAEDENGRRSQPREVPLYGPEAVKVDYTIAWIGD